MVLSAGLLQNILSVECCAHEPAFPRKVMTSTANIRYDDDRSKAAKEILVREWGDRYTSATYLSLRFSAVDVEKDLSSIEVGGFEKTSSGISNTNSAKEKMKKMDGCKLVRVIYANIEGHGAGRCMNARSCRCKRLRKQFDDNYDMIQNRYKCSSAAAVCTKCAPGEIGVHTSSKQYLLFKVYTNSSGDVETTVQLRCRSGHRGFYSKKGLHQYCSHSAHTQGYGKNVIYGGLPIPYGMSVKKLNHKAGYSAILRRLNPDLYSNKSKRAALKIVDTARKGGTIIGFKRRFAGRSSNTSSTSSSSTAMSTRGSADLKRHCMLPRVAR